MNSPLHGSVQAIGSSTANWYSRVWASISENRSTTCRLRRAFGHGLERRPLGRFHHDRFVPAQPTGTLALLETVHLNAT